MALLRRHKDDPGSDRFLMREKLLAIGDDFWIENDQGERAYKVNGKALRVRQTFVLEDTSGEEVAKIQEKKLTVRDKITVERGGDKRRASTRRSSGSGTASPSTSSTART